MDVQISSSSVIVKTIILRLITMTMLQVVSQQQETIEQQEELIEKLRFRLREGNQDVAVEDMEHFALSRLPKLVEIEDTINRIDKYGIEDEKSDNDSAIDLDKKFDEIHISAGKVSRHLQRSVSDVVRVSHNTSKVEMSPFCTKLYRGFLLRHNRRKKSKQSYDSRS